jgi:D-alanyl-D-alanine carboxypeptidase
MASVVPALEAACPADTTERDAAFRLTRALDAWRAARAAPPVAAAVRLDGRLIWTSDVPAPSPGGHPSRMPTYSLLKTFTAVALLRLQDRGVVQLDRRVVEHAPGAPVDARATLLDLMRHTSGMPCYGPLPEYHAAVRATPGRPWTDDAFLDVARRAPARFPPGHGWSYSNLGYLLLRRLLERVTDGPFAAVIDGEVVRPLGLADTFVAETIDDWATCVPGLGPEVDPDGRAVDVRPVYHPGWCAPGVGVSTPRDITRAYDALLGGGLVSTTALQAMLTMVPVPDVGPPVVAPRYGLGIHSDAGSLLGRNVGHGGGGPGYSLSATVYPETPFGRMAIAVGVTASRGPQADDCERHLARALLMPEDPS